TFSRYVQVQSSQPVTVVLYVINSASDQASSTLILPDSIYTKSKLATSYIVHSAFPGR
ncbi:hypothetical protein Bpfe_001433, partial [Biomphalaria pfeifferi]